MPKLADVVRLSVEKIYRPASRPTDYDSPPPAPSPAPPSRWSHTSPTSSPSSEFLTPRLSPPASSSPVLILLAAGKGTRFGTQPKCIQPVLGTPLARHSIEAFRAAAHGASEGGRDGEREGEVEGGQQSFRASRSEGSSGSVPASSLSPVASRLSSVCLIGYRHEEVAVALGSDNTFVLSDNPTGGTAYAVLEAFSVPGLIEGDPLVVITMGDRVVPTATFRAILDTHLRGNREADLTLLTARFEPPKHLSKGRIVRDEAGRVTRIVEERDIAAEPDALTRQALHTLTEGNCSLYVIRARRLHSLLSCLNNDNAQGQFYLTDIIRAIATAGGDIRTVTTQPSEAEYDLLCADITHPADLAVLEGVLRRQQTHGSPAEEIEAVVQAIREGRPAAQVASIARQLQEIVDTAEKENLGCRPDEPVAIGISGGRLRIAFMHPDMARFFGPAWQMPIGAGSLEGGEQIVVVAQKTSDRRLHLHPLNAKFRESISHVPTDDAVMFPGAEIGDWHSYEQFGTRMSETLLLSLGYFSDEEIETRRRRGLPLPPATLHVASNLRRPFALVGNVLASLRTLREGHLGARVQQALDRSHFTGLRLICTGNVPQGGFSSSSALTVASKNALNALFGLQIPPDVLVHLACQAEYGTGVRAGSLDQATEQKGRAGQGTLISSNPADNYRILGTYPVPADRFQVIFPYSVPRDREAWKWSGGAYAETAVGGEKPEARGDRPKDQGTKGAKDEGTHPSADLNPAVAEGERPEGRGEPARRSLGDGGGRKDFSDSVTSVDSVGHTLTAAEWRKLTGKAAEIAAVLTRLPLDVDFFKVIEADLLEDGLLTLENRRWITGLLRQLPLFISRDALQAKVADHRDWYIAELRRVHGLDPAAAAAKTDATFAGLFAGWRNPVMRREARGERREESAGSAKPNGETSLPLVPSLSFQPSPPNPSLSPLASSLPPSPSPSSSPLTHHPSPITRSGIPLRSMLAYLFSEVAKNGYLIHHPEEWTACVTRSQRGDRAVEINPNRLPEAKALPGDFPWEAGLTGPALLDAWLERCGAQPYDFNQGLDDAALAAAEPPEFHLWPGGSFFRGLALIDLAEAMLKRAFGENAVAVRVNAAGQGDFFQVHLDRQQVDPTEVKTFLRRAFYDRFSLTPDPEFVETHPGGGAVGLTLPNFKDVKILIQELFSGIR